MSRQPARATAALGVSRWAELPRVIVIPEQATQCVVAGPGDRGQLLSNANDSLTACIVLRNADTAAFAPVVARAAHVLSSPVCNDGMVRSRAPHHEPKVPMTPRLLFRTVAIAEAITWGMLITGMIMKYVLQVGEVGVQIGGFLHGLVFLAFGITAVLMAVNQHWSPRLTVVVVVTAIVPFGTIPLDRWLEKHGRLDGGWRRTRTDDPRDHTRVSALLRWMLARPVLFTTILVVGLGAVMTVLLNAGPPGGAS